VTSVEPQQRHRDNWSPHISPKRRAVEIAGKDKRCSSWSDTAGKIGNLAATCMGSSPSQLISLLLPLQERHWDRDKNVTIARFRVIPAEVPTAGPNVVVLYKNV
jgi:hypothetical protein